MEYVLHEEYGELKQAHDGDAGYDLYATQHVRIPVRGRKLVECSVSVAVPRGYVGFVCPRSGLALKHGITVLNAPGVIDSGYRGRISVILANLGDEPFDIVPQDRIAQLVVLLLRNDGDSLHMLLVSDVTTPEQVDVLTATERGADGFGSTGYNVLH